MLIQLGDSSMLLTVVIVFLLSLGGTYVLFKFLESYAKIENKKYLAGGAIAGFILIFGAMTTFYNSLEDRKIKSLQAELASAKTELTDAKNELKESNIEGTVVSKIKNPKVVLAIKQMDPDVSGKFRLSAKCIDPEKDDIKVYVVYEKGYKFKSIFKEDDMKNIRIIAK